MSTLIIGIVTFFLHALVLKLAVGTMGVPQAKNPYPKALSIAFGLTLAGFVIGFIPLISWFIYALVWLGVIMAAYDLGFVKSLGVAIMLIVLKVMVWIVLALFGLGVDFSEILSMGV
jgi:hypothetical protein